VPVKPRILGRYALYDKIASGGMATVHLGRLLGPVGFSRTVAIKRLHPHFAEDPEFVSMFLDEARVAARIQHPNVVPTLDVVTVEGELFLVMEYVQGESLARLTRAAAAANEHVPPSIATTVMVGVLHGLHAAHEAKNDRGEPLGLVHRDVSPQNVLVGVDGVPRVLDFGVAKAAGRIQSTREGQLKGKLPYMAPEQVRGKTSRASDVYAASVVLWEVLCGRRLFVGENDAELVAKVIEGCKVPPSQHAPGLPAAIDAIVLRGLEVDPSRRFATAREMARALAEAVPVMEASRIGEWVEQMAKEILTERSACIAAIESDSAQHVATAPGTLTDRASAAPSAPTAPAPRAALPKAPSSVLVTEVAPPSIVAHEPTITELSSGSSSAPRLPFAGRSRRWVWVGGVAVGIGLVAGILFAVSYGGSRSEVEQGAATTTRPEATTLPPAANAGTPATGVTHDAPVAPTTPSPSSSPAMVPPARLPAPVPRRDSRPQTTRPRADPGSFR
jgi:serine/threonine-protein kinase